jgi:uncharacterized membrane protein SirB2
MKPDLPATFFASQILRPGVGIMLYIVAAVLGWFVHPLFAVVIFILVGVTMLEPAKASERGDE